MAHGDVLIQEALIRRLHCPTKSVPPTHHDAVVSLQCGYLSLQVRELLPQLFVVGDDGFGSQKQALRS